MYTLGEAVGYIRLEMGRFLEEAQQASGSTRDIENEFKKLEDVSKQVEKTIVSAFAAIGAAVAAGLGKAVQIGSQFEASMSQVAATMGMTSDEILSGTGDFQKLSEAAMQMGETTKFSASQAADALNYLALAGYDTEQAISTLPTVLNLAASGGMDLARASDMITDAASALGLSLDDMSLFADKMAKAAQTSNTSVEQLGDAILQIGGTAKNLSGGVTELNTALGVLANNGIKGAEGGTALRQIILNLTAPTEKAAAYMEELGLKVADAEGNVRPLNEIFKDLNEILQSKGITGSADKIKALSTIFDARQLKSANALLDNYGETWDRLYDKIDNAEGAASTMATTMETNLKGALTILGSTAEGFGITVYNSIESSFKNAVKEATTQLSNLNNAFKSEEMQASLQKISDAISNAIIKLSEFLSETIPKLASGLSDLIDNFDKISAAIAGLVTTIGLAAAGATLYKIQTDLLTQSLIAQEIAQLAANAAALANPYTAVAVAIGILVAALVNEYQQEQQNIEQLDKLNEKYYDAEDAVNTRADSYDKEIEKARELENSRDDEISQINELLGLIERNVDESGNIISNAEMVKDAIDELNAILPTNIEYQGNQVTNYGLLTQASKDYCEQLKNEALLESKIEQYKTASVAYDEAINKRDALKQNIQEASEEYQKYLDIMEAFDKGYFLILDDVQKEAEAAGLGYSEYVEAMVVSTRNALDSTKDAYEENERIIRESSETLENIEVDIANTQNKIYAEQLKTGQEVTGIYASESEARIGIAQLEAEKLSEINRKLHEEQVSGTQDSVNDVITEEENLEAALEQLEIQYNTGVIKTDEEYHRKRLELLEQFHGEWSRKSSGWLKSELDWEQREKDKAAEEEKRRLENEKREREQKQAEERRAEENRQREAEQAAKERERLYREETNKKIEEIDRRKKRDSEYTDEQYLSDLIALRDTINKSDDLWQQLDDKIFDYQQKVTENNKKQLEQQNQDNFNALKLRKEQDENYTNAQYAEDLKKFEETLDKKSSLYSQVLSERKRAEKEVQDSIDEANKNSLKLLKDRKEYDKTYTDENYLKDLNTVLDTFVEGSEIWIETKKEIARVEENINKKNIEDKKKESNEYIKSLKDRLKADKSYTKQMYVEDLKAFQNTLDKESDIFKEIGNELISVNNEISDDNQNAANKAFQTWQTGFNALKSEAEKAYNEIQTKQKKLEETLNGQIDLYETKTKKIKNLTTGLWEDTTVKKTSVKFLQDQLKELNNYQKELEVLQSKNISDDLMAEIMGMDEESAKEYVHQLNTMSADTLKTYDKAYTDLKAKNKEFAEKYYEDEVKQFKENWGNKIQDYIDSLPEEAKKAAKEIIESFVNGLEDTDFDETNDVFNKTFSAMLGNFNNKIQNGDLFENYGTKSVKNLETEIKDEKEDLTNTCEQVGKDINTSFVNGLESTETQLKQQITQWAVNIKDIIKQQFQNIFAGMTDFDITLPQSVIMPQKASIAQLSDTAQTNNNQTVSISDLKSALKEIIPSGDVILNVDGNNFAKISRKSLNFLAQQNGELGLQV